MSSYTADQEKVVTRVLSYKPHQYYQILECEKTATDSTIKKSYRKLAVKLHPDKNSHPRASEAFKYLNKAWGVLSDPSKKRIFDQTGSDPDSRFSGFSNSSPSAGQTSGFARGFGGAHAGPRGFDDDIFNMFFGGGAPGGTTFTFGGNNGFTFQTFGNSFDPFTGGFAQQQKQRQSQRQSQRQQRTTEPNSWETLRQLAPMLLILFVTLFSSLFSGESAPEYSFNESTRFPARRVTPTFEIPYFVAEGFAKDKSERQLHNFDTKVEKSYISDKRASCGREQMRQSEMIQDAQGWFFTDEKRMEQAQNMPMPACSKLKSMGLL